MAHEADHHCVFAGNGAGRGPVCRGIAERPVSFPAHGRVRCHGPPGGGIVFGLGVGGLWGRYLIQSDPELRQREKERNDERNTAIRRRAKAWAGNVTTILMALGGAVSNYLGVPAWITWTLLGIAGFNVLLSGVFTLWLRRKM